MFVHGMSNHGKLQRPSVGVVGNTKVYSVH